MIYVHYVQCTYKGRGTCSLRKPAGVTGSPISDAPTLATGFTNSRSSLTSTQHMTSSPAPTELMTSSLASTQHATGSTQSGHYEILG